MTLPTWLHHLLTAKDNETIAIGRVLGLIVFVIFIMIVPPVAIVTVAKNLIDHEAWALLFDKLTVYVPAIILSVGGLIGITASSEPKGTD